MREVRWIVFDSGQVWTPALRVALMRSEHACLDDHRVQATQEWNSLREMVRKHPTCIAAIVVGADNFEEALRWISSTGKRSSRCCVVGLLDYSLQTDRRDAEGASAALREAGAVEVALSPRHMQPIVEIGVRRAAQNETRLASEHEDQPVTDRIWATLPWQPED